MKKQFNDPRGGMIIALGVLLTALWLVIAYGAYEESKREKYEVRVKPGAVTYGTHSTTTIPMSSVSMHRSAVPMISGGAIRHYAHYGHATMPSATSGSGYRLHTTSSATVHTIGSGGGGGGIGGASSSSSSSRGISYSGASVSMPTLAMATSTYATSRSTFTSSDETLASASSSTRKVRKAKPSDDGNDGDWSDDGAGDGDWWYWDDWAGEWIGPWDGALRIEGGVTYKYEYEGGKWVPVGDQGDPTNPTPIGDAPWHWMLLLMAVYGGAKVWKRNKTKNLI